MTEVERIFGWPVLKVRLERMERRMSLLKQRKEFASIPEHSDGSQTVSVLSTGNISSIAGSGGISVRNENKDLRGVLKATYKRSHGNSTNFDTRSDSAAACLLEPTPEHPWNTALIVHKTETGMSTATTTNSSATSSGGGGGGVVGTSSASSQKLSSSRTHQKGKVKGGAAVVTTSVLEGMQTHHLYPLPLTYVKPEPELARVESSHIEVPRWRYHAVTSCYQLEGTENLDDEVFFRRHHKLESDEKRRKRWDMQRIREQRHNDKLRQGRANKISRCHGKDQGDLMSFFPEPRDVQYVEVSETVPVVAFGCTVPQIQSSEFSLDWLAGSKPSQKEEQASISGGSGRKYSRSSSVTAGSSKKDT